MAGTAALALLAGCTASGGGTTTTGGGSTTNSSPAGSGSSSASASASNSSSTSAPAPAAVITTSPASATAAISPSKPVTVAIAGGRLTSVTMTNEAGKKVTGALDTDATSWHNTEDLGYGRTYSITAVGTNSDGKSVTKHSKVSTLTPANMTMAYLQRIGGYSLDNGSTYGVAIVPIVHFDEPITDEAAAQKALTVTTSPQVAGSWYWADDQNVHFRPETYWPSGTKVTVTAKIYGVRVGRGLYGQSDVSTSFTIGVRQITKAYDNAPKVDKVRVYRNGTLVKTMNTSMGKHSGETYAGTYIDFHTMVGTYTVLEHDNPAIMSSASYGLPANAPGGYAPEKIYYSTKISIDGIYLHQLGTLYAQNNGFDVSHGCLNLSEANASWFYSHSTIGDPVEIYHTDGPKITLNQGGDWSVPWSTWTKGSAL